jgi:hypothetical protein
MILDLRMVEECPAKDREQRHGRAGQDQVRLVSLRPLTSNYQNRYILIRSEKSREIMKEQRNHESAWAR